MGRATGAIAMVCAMALSAVGCARTTGRGRKEVQATKVVAPPIAPQVQAQGATGKPAGEPPNGPLAGKTICISPGHPSDTGEGATGPAGTTEIHINWVISLKLRKALEEQCAKVVMAKASEKEEVTNRRSAEIANESNADLFLRVHCDSGPGTGFGVFCPDRQGHRGGVTGPSRTVIAESRVAAKAIESAMRGVLAGELKSRGVLGDSITYVGEQQGALTGSIFSQVPVVCIEMCMLTNAPDEQFITSDSGQELMAAAITEGVLTYFRGSQG